MSRDVRVPNSRFNRLKEDGEGEDKNPIILQEKIENRGGMSKCLESFKCGRVVGRTPSEAVRRLREGGFLEFQNRIY